MEAPFWFPAPMDANELLRVAFKGLHKEVVEDVAGLSDEELFWQPTSGVNHIGFLLWHLIRDEDTVVSQSVLHEPELWSRERWFEQFAMDEHEQGTGLGSDRLEAFRYPLPLLLEYAVQVWEQTDAALAAMPAGRLEEALPWATEWRLAELLTTGCLNHGWVHLGEIRQLRGLQGWRFRE